VGIQVAGSMDRRNGPQRGHISLRKRKSLGIRNLGMKGVEKNLRTAGATMN